MLGLIWTPPLAPPSSAYFGTNCMSMKGDLPGLSKCWFGTIGSYQYSACRSELPGPAEATPRLRTHDIGLAASLSGEPIAARGTQYCDTET